MKLYAGPYKSKGYVKELVPPRPVARSDTYIAPNGTVTYGGLAGTIPGDFEGFSSLYTPKFNDLVSDGWVIQCPFYKERTYWDHTTTTIVDDVYLGAPVQRYYGQYVGTLTYAQLPWLFPARTTFSSEWSAAREEAIARAFAKANTGNADLLIDISQYKQTAQMFVSAGKRLVKLANTVGSVKELPSRMPGDVFTGDYARKVRAYPDESLRRLEELAGLWCEMRFGWRPLLATLEGVTKSLSDSTYGAERRVTYRAQESVLLQDFKLNATTVSACEGFSAPENYSTESKVEVAIRAGILLAERFDLADSLGLSLEQIPIAVWDYIPFSFIVDRFINVGNWIRSLRPIPSSDFGGAWVTERYTITSTFRGEHVSTDQSSGSGSSYKRWIRSGGTESARCTTEGVKRSIVARPPLLPTVRWDWSSINDTFNAIDGIMLVIQRLSPALRRYIRR